MYVREIENLEAQTPRYMAVDYGSKFIGLASYFDGVDPFPICYDRLKNTGDEASIEKLVELIELECINQFIMGVPFLLDGQETKMTKTIKEFTLKLNKSLEDKNISCNIVYQDETLSTYTAKERMLNSPLYNFRVDLSKIDSLSAKIILEDFLASQNPLH